MELNELTAHELHRKLKKKEIKAVDILESVFRRIDRVEGQISAFTSLDKKRAIDVLSSLDKKEKIDEPSFLYGIPVAVKDNICLKSGQTSCSSRVLKNFISPYSATVIKKLEEAGSVIFGKTNLDEFAMGSSTETSFIGPTHNPWDIKTIPGGSSGGSAAAVAADEAIFAIGSDTGGSIRQPAACCGVVGMKPSYGLVSRYGLVAFASSLDQIGPITKDVYDAALVLNVIAGFDRRDSTSIPDLPKKDYTAFLCPEIEGMRLGLPREYFLPGLDSEVEEAVRRAVSLLEKSGAEIIEISLPHTEYCLPAYYIIATAEASANLARYDGVKYGYRKSSQMDLGKMYEMTRGEGFGEEVKRRIMLGTYVLSSGYYEAYYLKAQKVRTLIKNDFDEAFKKVEAIITPTIPTPAFKIGERIDDPLQMYLSDIFTISVNLAGLPAISLPCGFSKNKLPIGLQIIGPYLGEEKALNLAYAYESQTDWHRRKPKLT